MAKHNITIEQGATFKLGFNWYNPIVDVNGDPVLDAEGNVQPDESNPVDLTDWAARMQVRQRVSAATPLLDLDSEAEGGITIDGPAGRVDVEATPTQTGAVTAAGVYDLELESPDGEVHRVLEGKAKLSLQVTR